ncbi:hypothetical protein [Sulfitobacter sp. JB4-11]|uniref:hypothetical protein n=1 Tax=Sulfitobacter rhodophyticola TaxID=3238304 RepID=UPI003519731B
MIQFEDENEVLATVRASAGRRLLGLVSLAVLGFLLIYIAFVRPPELIWQMFLIGVGAAALWMADAMRRATASRVELTPKGLRDGDGTVIAAIDDIEGMDRGFFAFKPSNGFLLKLRAGTGEGRMWRPGLWWRMGRRIGIGGMTPGNQTKFMSDILAAMMAERESPSD